MVAVAERPVRTKIAILGGGVAGVTAAYELSRTEDLRRKYEITVYQLGWRLGGKGASGRGPNRRIEEHGLHVWLGFYENAFRLMRDCYTALGRNPNQPLATLEDAFKPEPNIVLEDLYRGIWSHWFASFDGNQRKPGVPDAEDEQPLTMWWYFLRGIGLIDVIFNSLLEIHAPAVVARRRGGQAWPPTGASAAWPRPSRSGRRPAVRGPRVGVVDLSDLLELAATTALALQDFPLTAALELLERMDPDPRNHHPAEHAAILSLLETFNGMVRSAVLPLIESDEETRRLWQLLEIMMANVRGLLAEGLLTDPDGFRTLDKYDFYEWLSRNGAPEDALSCPFVRGLYDLSFAYRGGNSDKPAFAAGVLLRNMLRMFLTYKGAIFWKMQAGMGDVVFAPLYRVLTRRRVRFKFFHRVEELLLSEDKSSIERINISRQVELKNRAEAYNPLIRVEGLDCWPSEPKWAQIESDEQLPRRHQDRDTLESFWSGWRSTKSAPLTKGEDFDRVIFAISLGAIPFLCKELIEHSRQWKDMVDHVATVQTEAFQIWLNKSLVDCGWTAGSFVAGGYVEPFDTWAEMSHLIKREAWGRDEPASIHYFCNVMPGPAQAPPPEQAAFPGQQNEQVKADAIRFLRESIGQFLPKTAMRYPSDFRWELLHAPPGSANQRGGEGRFDTQFWRANVDPSERYVQSLPGSTRYRLEPGATGFDNLYIAGDWTECGVNAGCVEGAVISGMLAARAIAPELRKQHIVGYLYTDGDERPTMV